MPSAPELVNPNAGHWKWLAYELRFQRMRSGMSQAQAGVIAKADRKSVQNWEAARHRPPQDSLRRLDEAWETGGLLARIFFYAAQTPDTEWYEDYLSYERTSRQLRIYGGQVIPALFQTEGYMRACFKEAGVKDIDGAASERMGRQRAVLQRTEPPWIVLLLDECVLRRHAGGPEVMKDQYAALLEYGELNHIIIRVIPDSAGTHVGLEGSFTYLITDDFDLVLIASPDADTRMLTTRDDLADFQVRYDRISAKALSPEDTQGMIRHLMEEVRL